MTFKGELADWGIKQAKGGGKNERCLALLANLIEKYKPTIVAVEEPEQSQRRKRVQALLGEIIEFAKAERISVKRFSKRAMNRKILGQESGTKHALAERLAVQFSDELELRLPRKRRAWTSEPHQMDMFHAVGLAQLALPSPACYAV